ncbi:MAG TPA: outer membrane protein assembly factor BamB [Woeseiaceae bacterium]|nr:outer membrane protein assembly factor BamB [Woeseiaceae bacterium]
MRARLLVSLGAAVMIGGCGIFGDEDELGPAELVDVDEQIEVRRAWKAGLGDDAEFLRLALRPAGDGSRIYAASVDGRVSAFAPDSGKRLWRTELDVPLTAGPGVGQGHAVVVSADGYVIVLDAESGAERWRAEIKGESLATPLIADGVIVVQTVDNRLRALDLYDRRERWSVTQSVPALTQRGSANPVLVGSTVVAGFDNGRVLAVNLETGDTEWDTLLAPPSGRSDLERLSDVDGLLATVGQDVYAAGYQGRLAALASESGQIMWAREISSYEGLSADWTSVYTTQAEGIVIALSRRTGAENWRQELLLRREPTLPVPYGTTVVTGDYDGYLHFFSNVDGEYVARVRSGGAAVSAPPVVVGETLYVQTDDGELTAWRIDTPERPAAPAADAETSSGAGE